MIPATLAQLPASGPGAAGSFVTLGQVQLASAAEPVARRSCRLSRTSNPLGRTSACWGTARCRPKSAQVTGCRSISTGKRRSRPDRRACPISRPGSRWSRSMLRFRPTLPCLRRRPRYMAIPPQWGSGEVLRGRQNWQLDPRLPAGDYRLILQMIGPGGETSPPVELGTIKVAGRPHVFAPPAQTTVASGGRIGDFARLPGFDTEPAPGACGRWMRRPSRRASPQP